MSLQWVQTQTSLVPPHLHLYGAAHNSSAPVGRTELLLSDPADVSAATPRHLPPSAGGREGGGRHWQGREEPWKVGAKGASLLGPRRFVELLNIIWCPASWTFMSHSVKLWPTGHKDARSSTAATCSVTQQRRIHFSPSSTFSFTRTREPEWLYTSKWTSPAPRCFHCLMHSLGMKHLLKIKSLLNIKPHVQYSIMQHWHRTRTISPGF